MNAIELFTKDGTSAGVFACGQCRLNFNTEIYAEECCRPPKCLVCRMELPKGSGICEVCHDAKLKALEREQFEKAEKLTEWDGPVYAGEFAGDGFAVRLEDLLEHIRSTGLERPKYVWVCNSFPIVNLQLGDIEDGIADDAYDGFDVSDLDGTQELKLALEAFNHANEKCVRWEPDYTRVVLIPPLPAAV